MTLQAGVRVQIYWNLHKDCYSVVSCKTGLLVQHTNGPIVIRDATFVVQKAGRDRVLREKRKNVHAYVRGTWSEDSAQLSKRVRYNPYRDEHWRFDNGDEVQESELVSMTTENEKPAVWVG